MCDNCQTTNLMFNIVIWYNYGSAKLIVSAENEENAERIARNWAAGWGLDVREVDVQAAGINLALVEWDH